MRLRRPRPAQERGKRAGFAVRWVLVTPTFAAGLGVVIAAALAAQVPSSVLRYNGPPDQGTPCAVPGCATPGNGMLASAKPGTRILTPQRAARQPSVTPSGGTGAGIPGLVMQYRTVRANWNGDFLGEISFTGRNGQPLARWKLRFTYTPGHIAEVWAAGRTQPHGTHSAALTAGQYASGGWPQNGQVQIYFLVSGQPAPPRTCTIDGQRCHYTVVSGG